MNTKGRMLADALELARLERANWRATQDMLQRSGVPRAADDLLYRDTIAFNTGDCGSIAGTAEAILWTQANVPTALPAGYWTPRHLPRGGKLVKLTCAGKVTSAASSPGNLTLTLRYGVTTGGTSLAAGAANALATSKNNIAWWAEAYMLCTAPGASGTIRAWGRFGFDPAGALFTTAANNPSVFPATSPGADVTVDTTASSGVILTATLGSASDGMTSTFVLLEALT